MELLTNWVREIGGGLPYHDWTKKEAAVEVKIIYHGHSNLEIHGGGSRLVIDPFFTGNGLADVAEEEVNPTHILLSHAHGDHVGDTVAMARRTGAVVAANFEIGNHLQKLGVKEVRHMNHGGGLNFDFGRVTMTVAFHTSSFDDGTYGGQPGGWIVETGGKVIYFAGDTGLFGDMKLIGELWKIDLACLPIGDRFTMGPADAVRAAGMLKAKKVLPIHYNTFPGIVQDAGKFAADLKRDTGIEGVALKAGQAIEL
jgi:L-ascorbate metabolism protein UlaG (beta-lactamase superfamily)